MKLTIDLNLNIQGDSPALSRIETMLVKILNQANQMALNVSALTVAVAKLETVEASVLQLITTIAANQKDLAKQLADAIAANDPAALQAAQDAIDASANAISADADKLASAVTDNTPAV